MKEIDAALLREHLLFREEDSHKGDYGHALLVCGCERMPGAAVLATAAALESGCGLVTLHSTPAACAASVVCNPSAMLSPESGEVITVIPYAQGRYTSIGIGPGIGKDERTVSALRRFLQAADGASLVLDADALNIMSENRDMIPLIPRHSVLTPHFGELKRLLATDRPTEEMMRAFSRETGCVLVVKGPHTRIFHNDSSYANTTGNAGLAKGGSGDVLTGLITGLLSRGYGAVEAAMLGVWIHGFAGDCLSSERTAESYSSRDLAACLYRGFVELYNGQAISSC